MQKKNKKKHPFQQSIKKISAEEWMRKTGAEARAQEYMLKMARHMGYKDDWREVSEKVEEEVNGWKVKL